MPRAVLRALSRNWALWALTLGACILPISALAQAPAPRRIIRRIAIQGLSRESEPDILSRLKIRIGEVYEPERVSEETGNLYRMNKFQSVGPPQVQDLEDGVSVTFVVVERPQVVAVVFRGRRQLSEKHLTTSAPALQTKAGQLLNDAHVIQDRETILEKYLEKGYIFAGVKEQVEKTALGGVRVIFEIQEGTRVRIREVRFVGNHSVSSGTLLSLMETREKDFWFLGLVRSGYYDPERLGDDLSRIEQYYRRIGRFDARAEILDLSFDAGEERLTLTIRVHEGPLYIFRGYDFKGNRVFSETTLRELTTAVAGQPFNADVLERDKQAITDYYFNRSYIFARIDPKNDFAEKGDDLRVRFEIDEKGEVRIEEVRIAGNPRIEDRVIRRELEFYPGEKVDWSEFTKSKSNLNRLQILQGIDFAFEEGSSPDRKNVVVKVQEMEGFGRLNLGFGVTSGFGIIGSLSVMKRNFSLTDWPDSVWDIPSAFSGSGQTLILEAQPGTEISRYRVTFIEPYLFDTKNALSLTGQKRTLFQSTYREDRSSFLPSITHSFDFDRDLGFSLGARLDAVKISDLSRNASRDARDVEGYSTIIGANTGLRYDKALFDYLEGYYDGSANGITYEYTGGVLGGAVDLNKVDVSDDFYFPIFTFGDRANTYHHVISLSNRFGLIEPHESGGSVPIYERYYLGGARSVRGFERWGIGPHVRGEPIGGAAMLYGNVEYSFPIFQKILRGVVFMDYGNLAYTLNEFEWSQMRLAAGGGIRVNIPLFGQAFPIMLYFGYPIFKEDSDQTSFFLFTMGTPF